MKTNGKAFRKYKLSGNKIVYRSTGKVAFQFKSRGSAWHHYNKLGLDEVKVYV